MYNLNAISQDAALLWELHIVVDEYEYYEKTVPAGIRDNVKATKKRIEVALAALWPTLKLSEAKQLVTRFTELELNIRNYLHI